MNTIKPVSTLFKHIALICLSISIYSEGLMSNLVSNSVQTFPLFSLFAFVIVLLALLLNKSKISKKFFPVFIVYLYITILSLIVLTLKNFSYVDLFLRVFFSLTLGMLMLISFYLMFTYMSDKNINFVVFSGFFIVFILSIIEFIQTKERVKALFLFSEPSHLGYYLSLLVLPYVFISNTRALIKIALILMVFVNLILTFSSTGFYALFLLFLSILFISKNKKYIYFLLMSSLVALMTYILPIEFNYMNKILGALYVGLFENAQTLGSLYSFTDRFQLIYIFPHLVFDIEDISDLVFLIFGRGLGSEREFFYDIFPEILHYLPTIKLGSLLTSFHSKILVYGGVIIYIMFLFYFIKIIKELISVNKTLSGIILGILLSSFSMLGVFTMPIIWFWLAFAVKEIDRRKKFIRTTYYKVG